MRDHAHCCRTHAVGEYSPVLKSAAELLAIHTSACDIEDHDVRLNVLRIERNTRPAGQSSREQFGIAVVLPQVTRRLLERNQPSRGEPSGLPHAPAETFAKQTTFFDQFP